MVASLPDYCLCTVGNSNKTRDDDVQQAFQRVQQSFSFYILLKELAKEL